MIPEKEQWRKVSQDILTDMAKVPAEKQLGFIQERIKRLPEDQREMVGHFVAYAAIAGANLGNRNGEVEVSRHQHITGIVKLAITVVVILALAGLVLVSISGDDAFSKLEFWGARIETQSVGIACLAIAGLVFLFVARKALSRL